MAKKNKKEETLIYPELLLYGETTKALAAIAIVAFDFFKEHSELRRKYPTGDAFFEKVVVMADAFVVLCAETELEPSAWTNGDYMSIISHFVKSVLGPECRR